MAAKTFNEKLQAPKGLPCVKEISLNSPMARKMGGNKMLIAAPMQYDAIMKQIPEGRLITSDEIRDFLAKQHQADFTCQLTAGIFINIVAQASRERELFGQNELTPYWRTLKKNGELNEKYPGGLAGQQKLLEAEGHTVIQKGPRKFVKDFQDKLVQLK